MDNLLLILICLPLARRRIYAQTFIQKQIFLQPFRNKAKDRRDIYCSESAWLYRENRIASFQRFDAVVCRQLACICKVI